MLTYESREWLFDDAPYDDLVYVFTVDLQNTPILDKYTSRLLIEEPTLANKLESRLNKRVYQVGDAVPLIAAGGTKFVALVTCVKNREQDKAVVREATKSAIASMVERLGYRTYVSGILNRKAGCWDELAKWIQGSNVRWVVYKE